MPENFKPHIGKNVIETLTLGMYEDPRFIYREYIQNAADQIDIAVEGNILKSKNDGFIHVHIDNVNRNITIYDNATGISKDKIRKFLGDIANSEKDSSKRKGFRGIGRLGGLGYCEKLIFETSYSGEDVKSVMTLDAKLLRAIILDKEDKSDASAVISLITLTEQKKEDLESHYFRVTLENVNTEKILDKVSVENYLSMVCPLPFDNSFEFSYEIKNCFVKNNVVLDEYNIFLNDNQLYKAYKNTFQLENEINSKLIGVDFIEIRNDEQELLALCWYGYRNLSNIILPEENFERGIRIRHKNIAIGDEFTCKKFFSEERTNLYFIGEIHTISDFFIPNARRDYFNENNTCIIFENKAKEIFKAENLSNRLAQTASKLHNRKKEVELYNQALHNFKVQSLKFQSESEEKFHFNKLKNLEEKALKATIEIVRIKRKAATDNNVKKLFTNIIGDLDINIQPISENEERVSKYTPPTFSKLEDNEAIVVLEIFEILEEVLDFDLSELIKKRIIEKFN